jgi:hypothetical protein
MEIHFDLDLVHVTYSKVYWFMVGFIGLAITCQIMGQSFVGSYVGDVNVMQVKFLYLSKLHDLVKDYSCEWQYQTPKQ